MSIMTSAALLVILISPSEGIRSLFSYKENERDVSANKNEKNEKKMKIFFDKRNNSLTKSVCIIHKGKQTHLKF